MKKKLPLILTGAVFGIILFFLLLRKTAIQVFCVRQQYVKIANFRSSAFKLGLIHIDEEEKYINSIINSLYQKCLRKELP